MQPVLGGEEDGSRFATRPLVQTTLGTDRCVEHDRGSVQFVDGISAPSACDAERIAVKILGVYNFTH